MVRLEEIDDVYEYPLEFDLCENMEKRIPEWLRQSITEVFSGSFILPGSTWLSGRVWNPNCRSFTEVRFDSDGT